MLTSVYRTGSEEDVLLKDFRDGDTRAMRHIFQLHWKPQVFFATRFIPKQEIGEKFASEAFLKLWARREGFFSMGSVRSFLYTATRNACVDHLRKIKGSRNLQKEYALLERDRLEDSELTEVVRAELLSKVMASIDLLPN